DLAMPPPHFPVPGKCVNSVLHKRGSEMISRRNFIATTGAAVTVSSVGAAAFSDSAAAGTSLANAETGAGKIPDAAAAGAAEKSSRLFLAEDDLKPATYDRLSLD